MEVDEEEKAMSESDDSDTTDDSSTSTDSNEETYGEGEVEAEAQKIIPQLQKMVIFATPIIAHKTQAERIRKLLLGCSKISLKHTNCITLCVYFYRPHTSNL